MKKNRRAMTIAAIAVLAALPVMAQTSSPQMHQAEIVSSARIYGYDLAQGNWSYEQANCAVLPRVELFHYYRHYRDGAESAFTAIVPVEFGHVRIVPVLYHGATPFVPAPRDPRNFAIFNNLVSVSAPVSEQTWLKLGACYAEMTGGGNLLAHASQPDFATQAAPTVKLNLQNKTAQVEVSERDGPASYRLWSISFSRLGKVTAVQASEQGTRPTRLAKENNTSQPRHFQIPQRQVAGNSPGETTSQPSEQVPSTPLPSQAAQTNTTSNMSERSATTPTPSSSARQPSSQPGWKQIVSPKPAPSKFIPDPPTPQGKIILNPPNSPN